MNDNLLTQYMSRFAGYGNLDGDYWMIGMEDGGGDTVEEIVRRVSIWEENGQNQLEDLKHYHDKIGVTRWFGCRAKLQPTWNKLIRIIYGIKGISPQSDDIREYQRTQLGRLNGETYLAELMPLPSPSSDHWLYGDISALPELKSRKSYLRHWGPVRVRMLSNAITTHRPKHVVYYGAGYYQDWWSQLMPANNKAISIGGVKAYLGGEMELFLQFHHTLWLPVVDLHASLFHLCILDRSTSSQEPNCTKKVLGFNWWRNFRRNSGSLFNANQHTVL